MLNRKKYEINVSVTEVCHHLSPISFSSHFIPSPCIYFKNMTFYNNVSLTNQHLGMSRNNERATDGMNRLDQQGERLRTTSLDQGDQDMERETRRGAT